jgi:hypothetical protein
MEQHKEQFCTHKDIRISQASSLKSKFNYLIGWTKENKMLSIEM